MKGFSVSVHEKEGQFISPVLDINTVVLPVQGGIQGSTPKLSIMSFLLVRLPVSNRLKWVDSSICEYFPIPKGQENDFI